MADLSASLSDFLATYGLLSILVVMLVKEFGIPIPIPSDLIMITAGIQAASGGFSLLELTLAVEAAILIGGSAQFMLSRSAGRAFVYRIGRKVGLTAERLDRALAYLQRRGSLGVFVGLNVPGARAGIIPAAGLVGLGYPAFFPAMLSGSTIFYAWHVALGYVAGPAAITALEGLPLLPIFAGLALFGLLGWLLLRRRRDGAAQGQQTDGSLLQDWADAACPACLAVAALQRVNSD
jgi:LPXTG-motif cell wall-anchored protein